MTVRSVRLCLAMTDTGQEQTAATGCKIRTARDFNSIDFNPLPNSLDIKLFVLFLNSSNKRIKLTEAVVEI